MVNANPYQRYQQNAVNGAERENLTLMLYNGAIRFIKQGIKHLEEKNIQEVHNSVIRVQEIIAYLSDTLNMEYQISGNLFSLYEYINRRLLEVNIKKDSETLDEVLGLVEDLRNMWMEALKLSRSSAVAGL